jgi:hypothetical protein
MTWPLIDNHDDGEEAGDSNMIDLHRRYKVSLMQPGILEAALDVILKPLSIPFRYEFFLRRLCALSGDLT